MISFSHINRFIVRTPYYTLNKFHEIPKKEADLNEFVKNLFNDTVFKEAIFLASPELFYEWEKSLNDDEDVRKKDKIQASILKYFIRASTRCTPFGLFSGYTELREAVDVKTKRFSGLDLHFLYTVIKKINADLKIREYLKFSTNTSIYRVGSFYRYVEYKIKNKKREHSLVELEADEVLELIFNETSKSTKTITELVRVLLSCIEGVTEEDVREYIKGLIDAQILVSDLDIVINNESPLSQIILFFEENIISETQDKHIVGYYKLLLKLQSSLLELDANLEGNSIKYYEEIFKIAEGFNVSFEKKFLVNTNLHKKVNYEDYKLSSKEISEIKKAINALSLFSFKTTKTNLDNFKKAFYKRYEGREVPLSIVLDNEIGIGYLQKHNSFNSFSSLIDDVRINSSQEEVNSIKYHNKIHEFWGELLTKATRDNKGVIDLKKEDLSGFISQLNKLSNSFYVMLHKVANKISIEAVGGTSALSLIGRFASYDYSIEDVFKESVLKEREDDINVVVAELLHVPDNRSGNILLRNVKRDFEVAFLTKGNKNVTQIAIDDLYISLHNNKFILRSKKLNKRVKIINTTAHNYEYNALPIYQFLGDLQLENILPALDLNIGLVNRKSFNYIPRISYGDIVLSRAFWNYRMFEIVSFYDSKKNKIHVQAFQDFVKENNISRFVMLREGGDNTIRIDLENPLMYQFLEQSIRKNRSLQVEEALCGNNEGDKCVAEYIIPFFKKDVNFQENNLSVEKGVVKRSFIPGEEWLYYKIYTGAKTANRILVDLVKPLTEVLIKEKVIERWHFIRFKDPDFHLRLRFQLSDKNKSIEKITNHFNKIIQGYVENHFVWKIELATYDRELERYGWDMIENAENIFYRDSKMVVELLKIFKKDKNLNNDWLMILKSIDGLYNVFKIGLKERFNHVNGLYNNFLEEFKANRSVKKQIESKFRLNKNVIELVMDLDKTSEFNQIIEERNKKIVEDLEGEKRNNVESMKKNLTSFIHMNVNRMTISNPRMHELVVYGILTKYYNSKIGKEKYVKSKTLVI